jgi:hypothetical protein
MMMNYAKQVSNMMEELSNKGIEVNYNGIGFYTSNGYYVESSSVTNIYRENELEASYKTPKSAVRFLTYGL